jgi:predicted nucleic-acid-binding Zn-ribbon protein
MSGWTPKLFDEDDEEESLAECKHCGRTHLYWQSIIKSDGEAGYALFDEKSRRRHQCQGRQIDESEFPEA